MNEELDAATEIEAGAAGAPEGAVTEPTTDDVKQMYDELGIKAAAPSGKSKGRPKTASVRTKDADKDGAGNSDAGKQADDDNKGKQKDASDSDSDGDSGNKADAKSAKNSKDDDGVQDKSGEADSSVRDAKSDAEGETERGRKEDAEQRDNGAGQEENESDDETEEGKRPGKSNPKVEQRFQRLTSEVKERDELIEKLQRELQETTQAKEQAKIAQEDPEYTIDDFRKVRDEAGNIIDLDEERAELAWRRWQDGYNQRADERNAEANRQQALEQAQNDYSEKIMRQSVEAYDSLAGLMDEYPELVSTSGKFDSDFAAAAMPIIQGAIIYQEGTEPGNAEGVKPVIMGLKINPKQILDGMKKIQAAKRALPLNGLNDNVEVRSNVNVQHRRSSDPTVNAANELYKELNINKRI